MSRPKTRDSIKGEILNGMLTQNITAEDMAKTLNVSRSTFYRMMKQHTDTWTIHQVRVALSACDLCLKCSVVSDE